MEKNTKTILIVGGVAAVGLVTYMMYIAMNPAKPTTVVKSPTTTLANPSGISLNINNALSTIGSWFGAKSSTAAPAQTTTSFAGTPLKAGTMLQDPNGAFSKQTF